jgi:hypothetical protein
MNRESIIVALNLCAFLTCLLWLAKRDFGFHLPRIFLPKDGIWDSVYRRDGGPLPLRRWMRTLGCRHVITREYVRIDHRAGPGSFADNFEGEVCLNCGVVVREKEI